MADDYGFFHMMKDILFNGNKVSGNENDDNEKDDFVPWGGFGSDSTSSSASSDFNPSDSSGEAFRSVFGDDNH